MTTPTLKGTIQVPGDKSISHRAIIFGSIAEGQTTVSNFLRSNDCLATLQAFRQMGVHIKEDGNSLTIDGVGMLGLQESQEPLDMQNSGTSTRLMAGLLAGQHFDSHMVGDASLSKRPMGRVITPLSEMNGTLVATDGHLPMDIYGEVLHGIHYRLPIASAQVKSAIILAALTAQSDTTIEEPLPSRDHSETMLKLFSPESIDKEDGLITIHPDHPLKAQHVEVPADISSAAFFLVAGAIVPGSEITIERVGLNPTRDGIIRVLEQMGADLTIDRIDQPGEPMANLTIKAGPLKTFHIEEADIPALVDEVPILALLATAVDGVSTISGAAELRVKESDRLAAIASELGKLGASIEEKPDGLIITGGKPLTVQDEQVDSFGDHRIAMTLKVASLLLDKEITIKDEDCMAVSYPTFSTDLNTLIRK
ncbi:3-phosphoshikimate 1-carboxyvinyltransferase [Fructobacillus sp. M1-13]|uniref:3-phosphoshikimate 1-carboxyvinyltransferase n=1 Tax=Fructobacillus papyriferae TaxID=2713171 RepID=A0ABS5QQC9_9LACO|nr:3-phosphoshikimate 1-carboxyvinyltransferase [Fructobacillus papyriferae]MBS9335393.1 3-phosphoshikimate 1-carboxyvinyltransferase [Fructobacillus papyriferae]MCD2158937.1 3-phosphoshikimate 1-carboxyvinyltransferase [Fructobacillus papyriferae]